MQRQMMSVVLQVDRRRGHLFNYIIFLRVTPILPNIFINIASPVVDVPLRPFALGESLYAALVCPSQTDNYQLSVLPFLAEYMYQSIGPFPRHHGTEQGVQGGPEGGRALRLFLSLCCFACSHILGMSAEQFSGRQCWQQAGGAEVIQRLV